MKKIILALTTSILLACGNNINGTEQSKKDPIDLNNVLSLRIQTTLKKESFVCGDKASEVDIDVGCLLKSGNFYFILNNNTDYELTDVTITSTNPAFNVTPETITSIGTADKSTGITPMLRVAINHGTSLNDMSTPDALPSGTAKTEVVISGKVDGKEFNQSYVIGGYAKTIEVVRRNGVLFLEGPMYYNGALTESVQVYNNPTTCGSDGNMCWVYYIGPIAVNPNTIVINHNNSNFLAPLSNNLTIDPTFGSILLNESTIIEK